MHVKTANALLDQLKLIRAEIQQVEQRATIHEALELVPLLERLRQQVEVPMDWLRNTHHEGQKPR